MDQQQEFTDSTEMPFGQHKGKRMIDVPAKYLLWLFNEGCKHAGVRKYLNENIDAIKQQANPKR